MPWAGSKVTCHFPTHPEVARTSSSVVPTSSVVRKKKISCPMTCKSLATRDYVTIIVIQLQLLMCRNQVLGCYIKL